MTRYIVYTSNKVEATSYSSELERVKIDPIKSALDSAEKIKGYVIKEDGDESELYADFRKR